MEHHTNEGAIHDSEALLSTRHLSGKPQLPWGILWAIVLMFNLMNILIFNQKIMERSRIYDEPISTIEKLLENGRWVSI